MSDSGLVGVLDPRMLKVGPFAYPDATRNLYLSALRRFDRRFSQLDKATVFLRERRPAR
ncbi:hypothetical protein [Agromyces ramosus]|nr:hypothetical protein [Agromyces ramosus]